MTRIESGRRLDIVGMRCVAVLAVVFFHFGVPFAQGGFVGVDIFFVLSGYLITGLLAKDIELGRFSASRFFTNRVRRIIPAYFVMIFVTFWAAALIMSPIGFANLSVSIISAVLNVSNWLFAERTGYFDTEADTDPILHTWSLGVEWQFYLIWPAFLLLLGRRRFQGIAVISLCSLVAAELYRTTNASQAFYWPTFRVFEFGIGALLALRPAVVPTPFAGAVSLSGLTVLFVTILTFNKETPLPGFYSLIPCIGVAAVIISKDNVVSDMILKNPIAIWIGNISYSLYLVHWPVYVLTIYTAMRDLTAVETAAAISACFVVAQLLYSLVERPLHSKEPISFRTATAAALSIAGFITLATTAMSGWVWRVNVGDQLTSVLLEAPDLHKVYYGGRECRQTCETNPDVPRKLYIIGDSHARSLFAGAREFTSDVNVVFLASDACSVFLPDLNRKDRFSPRCESVKAEIAKRIPADDGDVIVTQYWSQAFSIEYFDSFGATQNLNEEIFVQKTVDYLEWLKSKVPTHNVFLMGDTPGFHAAFSPFECILRPFIKPAECETSSRASSRLKKVDIINTKIRSAVPIDSWIEPFEILCGAEGRCRNMTSGGLPIYSDSAHLSVWGSRYIFPYLEHFLPNLKRSGGRAFGTRSRVSAMVDVVH